MAVEVINDEYAPVVDSRDRRLMGPQLDFPQQIFRPKRIRKSGTRKTKSGRMAAVWVANALPTGPVAKPVKPTWTHEYPTKDADRWHELVDRVIAADLDSYILMQIWNTTLLMYRSTIK